MGIALLAGRDVNDHDTLSSPKVANREPIVRAKTWARCEPDWKDVSVGGHTLEPEQAFEIIGLVADTKYSSLREEFSPIVFLSTAEDAQPDSSAQFVIRSSVPMSGIVSTTETLSPRLAP
jgi:putative ABC transport system permease protein